MKTTKQMYQYYKANAGNKVSDIIEKISEERVSRRNLDLKIRRNKKWIEANTNISDVNKIILGIREGRNYIVATKGFCKPNSRINANTLNEYISKLRASVIRQRNLEAIKAEHIKNRITQEIFNTVIGMYNNIMLEDVIANAGVFSFGGNIGNIYIIKKARYFVNGTKYNNKVIDWGESNKLKAKIIAQGGTLYIPIRDSEGNIIGDNGGTKWQVRRIDDYSYWFRWKKSECRLPNSALYAFRPTRFNNTGISTDVLKEEKDTNDILDDSQLGAVQKLHIYRHCDPDMTRQYDLPLNERI